MLKTENVSISLSFEPANRFDDANVLYLASTRLSRPQKLVGFGSVLSNLQEDFVQARRKRAKPSSPELTHNALLGSQ
jgi:hypothetical protein